jgi:hypothetical protein
LPLASFDEDAAGVLDLPHCLFQSLSGFSEDADIVMVFGVELEAYGELGGLLLIFADAREIRLALGGIVRHRASNTKDESDQWGLGQVARDGVAET